MRLAFAIPLVCLAALPTERGQFGCDAVADTVRAPDSARLASGTYSIIIVATEGPRTGYAAGGKLTLVPARPTDRSPRTGEGPARSERQAATPLWGYLTADLRLVAAPLPDSTDSHIPLPGSDDPIYPGVLVQVQNWQAPSLGQENQLWVASGTNLRADLGLIIADGPGIVMRVRELDSLAMRGTWGPAGRPRVGGYFCARRLP